MEDSLNDLDLNGVYEPTQDEKNIAMLSHVLTLFAWFIPPLVIYILKKDESEYIRDHAVESLNFQITLCLYIIVSCLLMLLLIGFLLIFIVSIAALVYIIIATVRASEGEYYDYPYNIRWIS